MGEISISGTLMKVDELANSLQVCLDSGAKKVLLPITSAADLATVPADLIGAFQLIFYSSAEDVSVKPPHDLHLHLQYVTILPYSSR